MSKVHRAAFSIGASVRIKERTELERFARDWTSTNSLTPHQFCDAGVAGVVDSVAFDDGGNPLYTLERIGGIWHEENLVAWGASFHAVSQSFNIA